MTGKNWQQTGKALETVVPICTRYDSDGVDVHFLNASNMGAENVRSAQDVYSLFAKVKPSGATPTGKRLGDLLDCYLQGFEANRNAKPLNIICITDGVPSDPARLERTIVSCAKKLDNLRANDRQVGVQFFQVGNDEAATEALEELDNSLVEEWGVRDMVDTVSWRMMNGGSGLTGDGILKCILGAVDCKLDRKRKV
jgi:hypothetical protein